MRHLVPIATLVLLTTAPTIFAQDVRVGPRIRPDTASPAILFDAARRRTKVVPILVDKIQASNLIVYLVPLAERHGGEIGRFTFVISVGGVRYARIWLADAGNRISRLPCWRTSSNMRRSWPMHRKSKIPRRFSSCIDGSYSFRRPARQELFRHRAGSSNDPRRAGRIEEIGPSRAQIGTGFVTRLSRRVHAAVTRPFYSEEGLRDHYGFHLRKKVLMFAESQCTVRPRRDRRDELLSLMMRDFQDMPRLAVTSAQARRLWALDEGTCDLLLGCLIDEGFLRRRADGMFVVAGD